MNIFYIFALCLFYFKASVDGSGIPVLLWTNKQNVRYPMLISGKSLSDKDFSNGYLEQIVENGDQNLVVFVQDELSLNDITNNADVFNDNSDGDVFSSVKNIMEKYESTHVSSVANPADAVKKLQRKFKGNIHPVENLDELKDLTLSDDTPNMVIISLPKSVGTDKRMALKQSDGIMGEVTEKFARERRSFSAVFTAYEASEQTHEERANVGGRRLLAVQNTTSSNETYTFFKLTNGTNANDSCLFFFYSEMLFQVIKTGEQGPSYGNGTIYNFPPLKSDTEGLMTGSKCDSQNNTATLTIDYANGSLPEGITKFSMSINVIGSVSGYWTIQDWTISFSGKNKSDETLTFEETDFQMRNMNNSVYGTLPYQNPSYGFCYYCGDQVVTQLNTTSAMVQLQFKQFQLQLNVYNNVFGPVNDCMGFFSGPIWMTLIFILLALTILSFGTGLLSNIQTMDRFDDPKGKTIQVNTAD